MTLQEAITALVFGPSAGGILVENKRSHVRYWIDAAVIDGQCTQNLSGERVAWGDDPYVYGWREGNLRRRGGTLPSYQWFFLRSVKLLPVSEWETT